MQSVSNTVALIKSFCEASGAAVNWSRTCGFFYGEWGVVPLFYESVRWSKELMSIFGDAPGIPHK